MGFIRKKTLIGDKKRAKFIFLLVIHLVKAEITR